MVLRRCPQCNTTSDDKFGFCVKCGYEFPKIDVNENTCPLCGSENPPEATYCVKCGTPLIFKNASEQTFDQPPIFIKYSENNPNKSSTSKFLIIMGYIFCILGGIVGLIIAIYLATRKDPVAKKHGRIQLGILILYVLIIALALSSGLVSVNDLINATTYNQSFNMTF